MRIPVLTCLVLAAVTASPGMAADHSDSPAAQSDPLADILDLYAFVAADCQPPDGPGCGAEPDELILALTVSPSATGATQFSADIVYRFHLENESGATSRIDCSFSSEQVVTCAGPGGRSVQALVGEIARQGDLRVYAGLRDDPFFFDREAFAEIDTLGVNAFSPPGTDHHAGANVLALVVGIKIDALPAGAGPGTNIQKIWASSERTAGGGIGGAITGSWYNADQNGQGWVLEIARPPSGADLLVVYFYGYDNNGEQLWLLGVSADIVDNTAIVEVMRTSAVGFGGEYDPFSMATEPFGTMIFTFHDCDSGTVEFIPIGPGQLAFTTDIERLTNIATLDCAFWANGQVDRQGRPLVADFFVPEAERHAYNTAADPAAWAGLFRDQLVSGIEALDLADGVAGNLLTGDPQELAAMFADDRLQIDLRKADCLEYAALEMALLAGQPGAGCGGRRLDYDVVDDTLGLVVSGFATEVGDYVYFNDAGFLPRFPYLAAPHRDYEGQGDIMMKLQGLSGIAVNEIESPDPQKRVFRMDMEQPVDHDNPGGPKFTQTLYLHHVGEARPMVFAPSGYEVDENYVMGGELTAMLQANLLSSSHRYWPGSRPEPTDYQYLTIAQAAADHHEIVARFREIYRGAWLSAGVSKNAMTVIYHKRFYPADVTAAVAIAAPFKFGTADERYPEFLSTIGTSYARQRVRDFQRLALERRGTLLPMFEAWFPQNGYVLAHDPAESFESTVISFQPEFWEQRSIGEIGQIPGNEATDQEILNLLHQIDSFAGASESAIDVAAPFFYQAYTEEGLEAKSKAHLSDLLETSQIDILALFNSLLGIDPVYDPAVMNDIYEWVINFGNNMIFIYGGNDPWTAGAVNLTGATNAIKVVNPGDNHSVFIGELPGSDRNLVISALEQWLDVDIN